MHFEITIINVYTCSQQAPVPITSYTDDSVTITYDIEAPTRIRYNWYRAPCAPALGPLMCAIYSNTELLPALPFIMNITVM